MVKKKDRRKKVMLIILISALLVIILSAVFLFNTTNEYTMKYKKVIDEFVKDYYPGLSGKKIFVFESPFLGKGSASAFPFPPIVTVSTKVRNYSEDSIKGLFAHELAHMDNNRDKSIFYFVGWVFDKKVRAEYEREADEKVIEVGLGQYLLASAETDATLYSPEELEKRYSVYGYLSPEEIIQEMESRKAS
jgi:hypothetical protein